MPLPAYAPPPRPAAKPKPKAGARAKMKIPADAITGPYAVLISSNLKQSSALANQKRLAAQGYPASVITHKDKKDKT